MESSAPIRFEVRPDCVVKEVPGDGDCSVHALVCAILAWLVSLDNKKHGLRKAEVYTFLKKHCFADDSKVLIPSNLRLYIGSLGNPNSIETRNVLDLREWLDEGADFFFTTASNILKARINVWIKNEYKLFGSPEYDFDLHIENVTGHFQTLVPHVQLYHIMLQLGDKYEAWEQLFFSKVQKYLRDDPKPRYSPELGWYQNVLIDIDDFHRDITAAFQYTFGQPPQAKQKAPQPQVSVYVKAGSNSNVQVSVHVNTKPAWEGAWKNRLESRLKEYPLDQVTESKLIGALSTYLELPPEEQASLDKSFFEMVDARRAAMIAKGMK